MKKGNFENKIKDKLYDYVPDMDIPEYDFMQSPFIITPKQDSEDKKTVYLKRFYYISGIAASLLIILSVSFQLFYNNNFSIETKEEIAAVVNSFEFDEVSEPQTPTRLTNNDPAQKYVSTEIKNKEDNSKSLTAYLSDIKKDKNTEETVIIKAAAQKAEAGSSENQKSEVVKSQRKAVTRSQTNTTDYTLTQKEEYSSLPASKKRKSNRFAMGVLASNGSMKGSNNISDGVTPYIRLASDLYGFQDMSYEDSYRDFKHKMPVRAGLSFGYYLTRRIMFESGVTYSYLESDFTVNSGDNERGKQKLHYIGVPVALSLDIISRPRYRIYAGVGAEADFNVKAIQKYNINGTDVKHDSRNKYPIWSYRFKAGAAWNLFPDTELYIEPSYARYTSKTQLKTAWTDDKSVLDLNFGLRTKF